MFVFRLSPCHGALGHSQSVLVATCTQDEIHLCSLQPCCALDPEFFTSWLFLQGWQGISASQPLPKALQEVQSCRGDRGSASWISCPICVVLGCRDLWNQREESSLLLPALQLTLADPGHNVGIRITHSLFVTMLDVQLTFPASVSNADRHVVVNTSLEITFC